MAIFIAMLRLIDSASVKVDRSDTGLGSFDSMHYPDYFILCLTSLYRPEIY